MRGLGQPFNSRVTKGLGQPSYCRAARIFGQPFKCRVTREVGPGSICQRSRGQRGSRRLCGSAGNSANCGCREEQTNRINSTNAHLASAARRNLDDGALVRNAFAARFICAKIAISGTPARILASEGVGRRSNDDRPVVAADAVTICCADGSRRLGALNGAQTPTSTAGEPPTDPGRQSQRVEEGWAGGGFTWAGSRAYPRRRSCSETAQPCDPAYIPTANCGRKLISVTPVSISTIDPSNEDLS